MAKILIASNNRGKLAEIQALLADNQLELLTPHDLGLKLDVQEDGLTYAENAARKALAFSQAAGLPALADDTGLEVAALQGAPGLYSARFAPGKDPSDADRRNYLLSQLVGQPRPWQAQFRCVVALAVPGEEVIFREGLCQGEIIPEERGQHGFGYDPIFLINDLERTMAELEMEAKNRLSHRARAILAIRDEILALTD